MSNKKETWKTIKIDGRKPSVPYAVSNHGRFGVMRNGKVEVRTFKPTGGTYRYNTRQQGKNKAIFITQEVAKAFLGRASSKQKYIIHKDHNYLNDHVDNLKWASMDEHRAHTIHSPASILAREKKAITKSSHAKVLTDKDVKELKTKIWDPKRKLSFKALAEKYGVSEMQIYRIKSGEFWYHIKVENEPIHPKYKQNLSNIVFQEKLAAKKEKQHEDIKKKKKKKHKDSKKEKKHKKKK